MRKIVSEPGEHEGCIRWLSSLFCPRVAQIGYMNLKISTKFITFIIISAKTNVLLLSIYCYAVLYSVIEILLQKI